jgi:hypothetical protein
MNHHELSKHLLKLGYTAQWLDYGLLTDEHLLAQVKVYDTDDDKNTEHYRYNTFRNYLATKDMLTDLELDHYIELALSDHDKAMAGAALIDLFTRTHLSDRQFHKLITQLKSLGDWTSNTIARQILLRRLKQEKLNDELFRECFEKGDNFIQEYLIDLSNREQLEVLSLQGRTKKIRNMASQMLSQNTENNV